MPDPQIQSRAILGPRFLALTTQLAADGTTLAQAAEGTGNRAWQTPPLNGWSGSTEDLAGMAKAFDRGEANAAYSAAILDPAAPGTVGDLVAMKTQIDYVAAMERAYRARSSSPLRCRAHASGRRQGHGDPAGVFLGGVLVYVQNALAAASPASSPPPVPAGDAD